MPILESWCISVCAARPAIIDPPVTTTFPGISPADIAANTDMFGGIPGIGIGPPLAPISAGGAVWLERAG
jgi:hypothetical protein